MAIYSIKDLENLTGIKAHTIRIWEKRYKIVAPSRTNSNIRVYDDDHLKHLLNIAILNKNGIKISKIAKLTSIQLKEKVSQISQQGLKDDLLLENLLVSMIELNDMLFEKTLSTSISKIGFEETFIKILTPLFKKIGILWQTNSINPAQEHFISNLVRQKTMVAIDELPILSIENPKKFMLFLPEGELHELGLLFAQYLIRKSGHKVVYLGQSVPLTDIAEISKIVEPDYFFTSYTSSTKADKIKNELEELCGHFKRKKIYVTGLQLETLDFTHPQNLIHIPDFQSFKKHLFDMI